MNRNADERGRAPIFLGNICVKRHASGRSAFWRPSSMARAVLSFRDRNGAAQGAGTDPDMAKGDTLLAEKFRYNENWRRGYARRS
jgi:hypothetical protein